MHKTYLALSNKQDLHFLRDELTHKYKDITPIEITSEEIKKKIQHDFYLLVTDYETLKETDSVHLDNVKGQIWYINPNLNQNTKKPISKQNMTIFHSASSVVTWLKFEQQANPNISQGKPAFEKTQVEEKKKTTIEKKETEEKKKTEQTDSPDSKEEQKKDKKDSPLVSEDENDIINESEPVTVDPYPPLMDTEVTEKIKNDCNTIELSEYEDEDISSIMKRIKTIREKERFPDIPRENHKVIGVWSPLHRMGVTTFIMNFAIFFGHHFKMDTAVIESPTSYQLIKTLLKQYNPKHKEVEKLSYLHMIEETPLKDIVWHYHNVAWFPLNEKDMESFDWQGPVTQAAYSKMKKDYELILVDLPTGDMKQYTKDTLALIDELWILVDGSYHQIISWGNYINQLVEEHNMTAKLLFVKHYPFTKKKDILGAMNYPIISKIPDLSQEVYRSYKKDKPMILQEDASDILIDVFDPIAKDLLKKNYTEYKRTWAQSKVSQFLSSIKTLIK
ncbi:hypothetical protein [Bacillus alkalicellulosilyticus]|uniref:hypothetical protein n=1 Tax=Alkalihalobacterium alkalicellulosilyticum TaxID=1912214 RepID=UPI0009979B15|nr:hypothetical protein [Bacillus alkalicellulosilyticus]